MAPRWFVLALVAAAAALPAAAHATLVSTAPPIAGPHTLAILRPCAASQLKAAVTSNAIIAMHREVRITLTNAGASACAINGYPAVRLLDELKHPRIVAESFSDKPRMFILAPDQQAAFRVRAAIGDGTTAYMTAPTLAIIPPGDISPLLLNVDLPVAPAIEVSALLPPGDVK
ncbi:MAG: hypothetical protein QOJ39_2333 [Candidatus Eremiobacteraeota bacterium]|jgi:hypothetical protein|nr:hypothetical protein [Candidatus Eremiobacteraeota bacterium]